MRYDDIQSCNVENTAEHDDNSKPALGKREAVFLLAAISPLIISIICLFFDSNPIVRHILVDIVPGIANKPGIKENLIEIFWSLFVLYVIGAIYAGGALAMQRGLSECSNDD